MDFLCIVCEEFTPTHGHTRTRAHRTSGLSMGVFYAVMFTAGIGGLKLRCLQFYQWTVGHVVYMQDYGWVTSIQK